MAIALRPPRPLIALTVAASSVATQSHSTLPPLVRSSSARWPIANFGSEPMPRTPGSYSRQTFLWLCESCSSVVQLCPPGGTYCRSSSQMTHCAGGKFGFLSLGGYCMPQAVQMKQGIRIPRVFAAVQNDGEFGGLNLIKLTGLRLRYCALLHRSRGASMRRASIATLAVVAALSVMTITVVAAKKCTRIQR